MKLLKLALHSNYGSLKQRFKIAFRDLLNQQDIDTKKISEFHPFCFAGLNGSGKSNVLETLANIFFHLESCANINQPEIFKDRFDPTFLKPDAFDLEYLIYPGSKVSSYTISEMVKVNILKEKDTIPRMTYQNYPFNGEKIDVTIMADEEAKLAAPAKLYLPELVIGYSSGENEILSIPFLKTRLLHFDEYREALRNGERYVEPESNLIYIDYQMSQAVLLSNFIFQDDDVLQPIRDKLDIIGIKRFRMNLNLHDEGDMKILDQFADVIRSFKKCATSYYEDEDYLTLDFWINPATKSAFKENFPKGIFQLFRAFQVLYTLNYRTVSEDIKSDVYQSKGFYTDGKVPSPSPEEQVFYFLDYYITKVLPDETEVSLLMKNLSDGEQQFLHTLGICLMLNNKSALLLLDEPETHFNPDWRSKFMSTLQKCLEASKGDHITNDVIITTHSPFIVSDSKKEYVFIFDKGNVTNPKINTFGTSVNIITEEVFNKKESIGDLPLEEIETIKKRPLDTLENIQDAKESARELGESVEKVLLFRELILKEQSLKEDDKEL